MNFAMFYVRSQLGQKLVNNQREVWTNMFTMPPNKIDRCAANGD